jgi:hypothetical protein
MLKVKFNDLKSISTTIVTSPAGFHPFIISMIYMVDAELILKLLAVCMLIVNPPPESQRFIH